MGENAITVIEISPSSSEKEEKKVFRYTSSSSSEESGTPVRRILCIKNAHDVKQFEETEECFILDFDPFDPPIDISKLSMSAAAADDEDEEENDDDDAREFVILAEKGQVWVFSVWSLRKC